MKCSGLFLLVSFLITLFLGAFPSTAQVTVSPSSVSFTINTQDLYNNGTTADFPAQVTRTLLLGLLANITLTVQANSAALASGANTIPLNNVTIQVTKAKMGTKSLTVNSPVIHLSTAPQTILSTSILLSLGAKLSISLRYAVTGGTNLLKAAGSYSTGLNFHLTIGSTDVPFTVNPLTINIADLSIITLKNGAAMASLTFATAGDYKNGVQFTQPSAVNVFSNRSYKVSVQSATNFKYGLNYININNISLSSSPNPVVAGVSTATRVLSLSAQNIITSTLPTLSQNYDLKYFTPARDPDFIGKPAGTYSTTLTYTLTAP